MNKDKRIKVEQEFARIINRFSLENGSNTPDFMLAKYLVECLEGYNTITRMRETWYSRQAPSESDVHVKPTEPSFEELCPNAIIYRSN